MNRAGHPALCRAIACALLFTGTGCLSVVLESEDLISGDTRASSSRGYRFRVESVDGTIDERKLSPAEMNAALERARPDLYGAEDSIPLAIRIGGGGASVTERSNPLLTLIPVFMLSATAEGEWDVKIYQEDGKTKRTGHAPYKTVTRTSLFPWALMVSEQPGRVVVFKRPGGSRPEAATAATEHLLGSALGKAIDALTEEEIGELSKRVPLTLHDVVRRRRLESLEIRTVHLDDAPGGRTASTVTHQFKGVEEEAPRKHPAVLEQDYNAARRIGEVRLDETGFGKEEADDFALRLISRICETKAVVVDLGGLPPPGARYRILRDQTGEGNIRVILFEQIQ